MKVSGFGDIITLSAVGEKLEQAKEQLQGNRQSPLQTYRDALKLRTYTVVDIGFEKIVWEEVS